MPETTIAFYVEDSIKEKAERICEELGLDIEMYLTICLRRLCREQKIPFAHELNMNNELLG